MLRPRPPRAADLSVRRASVMSMLPAPFPEVVAVGRCSAAGTMEKGSTRQMEPMQRASTGRARGTPCVAGPSKKMPSRGCTSPVAWSNKPPCQHGGITVLAALSGSRESLVARPARQVYSVGQSERRRMNSIITPEFGSRKEVRRQIELEVAARYTEEKRAGGLLRRALIAIKIRKEVSSELSRRFPPQALYQQHLSS
jgi:hypothetical protein